MRRFGLAVLVALGIPACGGGGTGGGGGGATGSAPDTQAPAISLTSPASGASGVAHNTLVIATFSEAMDAASVTASTLLLSTGGNPVPGTVSYDPASRSGRFDPASNLAASTTYTATVTTGVKDVAGNALAAPYAWSFTTGGSADATPPAVTSKSPAAGATGVILSVNCSAVFNEAMDPATISTSSFTLAQGGVQVSAGVSYDPASKTALLNPVGYLTPSTVYTATLTTAVKDASGNALASAVVWSFTTAATLTDNLGTATGPGGPFNPDQVLDYYLTLAPADWDALVADGTNSIYFQAQFHSTGEPSITVGVRRKRSGTGSGDKVGLKIDINTYVAGQTYHDLRKLSLENGISSGSSAADVKDLLAEYLAWRWMSLAGVITGRAALCRVHVNGTLLGVYVNVEVVDKRFLEFRIGDNDGWLYKKSGSSGDGYKTNEGTPNPYEDYFTFWSSNPGPVPSDLETSLPQKLDILQMLKFGAVNAIMSNSDAPLGKDNNYYFYDYPGGRIYFPWDLDTTMKDLSSNVFTAGRETMYRDVLFTHWEDDYDAVLTDILAGPLTIAAINAEIDRIATAAGASLDADPNIGGDTASSVSAIKAWWSSRLPTVQSQVDAHAP